MTDKAPDLDSASSQNSVSTSQDASHFHKISDESFSSNDSSAESPIDKSTSKVLITRSERRRQEWWFGFAYTMQGIENGALVIISAYLEQQGVSASLIGVFSGLGNLPVFFRIPVSIFSDRMDSSRGHGRRRPFILLGFIMATLGLALLAASGSSFNFTVFLLFNLIREIGHELWDNGMDAYANETTPKKDCGRVQNMIMNGPRSGGVLIGLVLSFLISDDSFPILFGVSAILIAVPALFTFCVAEPQNPQPFEWRAFDEFKRPEILWHAVFVFVGSIPLNALLTQSTVFLSREGNENSDTTLYLGLAAVLFFIATPIYGYVFDRRRQHISLVFHSILLWGVLSAIFFIASTATGTLELMLGFSVGAGIGGGSILGLNFALVMLELRDACISASFMAIFATIGSVGYALGGIISGVWVDSLGFPSLGIFCLVLFTINFPVVHLMFKDQDYTETGMEMAGNDLVKVGKPTQPKDVELTEKLTQSEDDELAKNQPPSIVQAHEA